MTFSPEREAFLLAQIENQRKEIKRLLALLKGPSVVLPVTLPAREHAVLGFILAHAPHFVDRRRVAAAVYTDDDLNVISDPDNLIDCHVSRLRKKLMPYGAKIEGVRGMGWRIPTLSAAILTGNGRMAQ